MLLGRELQCFLALLINASKLLPKVKAVSIISWYIAHSPRIARWRDDGNYVITDANDMKGNAVNERQELRQRDGLRFRCRATVVRFGTKPAYKGEPIPTILLRDVVDARSGTLLTDHLWFTCGKWSDGLAPGDTFLFDARAGDYIKGYRGRREDYDLPPVSRDWKLQRPTRVVVLRDGQAPASDDLLAV